MVVFIILYALCGVLVIKLTGEEDLRANIMELDSPIMGFLVYLIVAVCAPVMLVIGIIEGLLLYFKR